ncbi:MAG TPA: hypothetical protein VFO55_04000 [Gemmatimonadaceae bacterium]|nr:hypothetical protein [Gemmatimonadaceae bacterium]
MLSRLWNAYFHAGWEGTGRIYERLGIRRVGRFMIGGYYTSATLSRLRGRPYRTFRGRRAAQEWLVFTLVAELGHGVFFLVMLWLAIREALKGDWRDMAITTLINLVVNVIPIMVQRYNRARIVSTLGLTGASVLDARFWSALTGSHDEPAVTERAEP